MGVELQLRKQIGAGDAEEGGELHHDAYFQAYTLVSHHALTVAARKRAA